MAMIWCMEDDESIRALLSYSLRGAGMEVRCFERPSELKAALRSELPDLLLLDIMLPEESGLEVLRALRADVRTEPLPVILLTAKSSETDKVEGLDAGADDYVAKPFSVLELTARIRTLLRRRAPSVPAGGEYRVGELYLNESACRVSVAGESVPVTRKEFQLLTLLFAANGAVLTRDEILRRVWGYSFDGENRTVDVHVRSLRQKLGTAGALIETVRGVGYRIGGKG